MARYSLGLREMQIEMTLRYFMDKIMLKRRTYILSVGDDMGRKRAPVHSWWWECELTQPRGKAVWPYGAKLKMYML